MNLPADVKVRILRLMQQFRGIEETFRARLAAYEALRDAPNADAEELARATAELRSSTELLARLSARIKSASAS